MLADGELGEMLYLRFDERVSAMAAIQVACERIRGTPTPFTYHASAAQDGLCVLLPAAVLGWWGRLVYATPAFCAVVAYAFFGLDTLGDELEEPFGQWLNSLPLHAMARVEISLLEGFGRGESACDAAPCGLGAAVARLSYAAKFGILEELLLRRAPVAQLDRAAGYEPVGRRFESFRAHHSYPL